MSRRVRTAGATRSGGLDLHGGGQGQPGGPRRPEQAGGERRARARRADRRQPLGVACGTPLACEWGPVTGLLERGLMTLDSFHCERGTVVGLGEEEEEDDGCFTWRCC